jgi:hypothetical protein
VKSSDITLEDKVIPAASAGTMVMECPQGMYSTGGSAANVNALFQACPAGSTTASTGSTAATDCNRELKT